MPEEEPQERRENPRGLVSEIFRLTLAFMDRPWRAIVVIILVLMGGIGWFVWDQRDRLLESYLTPSEVSLNKHDIPEVIDTLAKTTGAELVQIWSVDANWQRFIAARRADGERPVIPEPRELPVFSSRANFQALAEVLAGSPACIELDQTASHMAQRLFARGFTWGCAVPIPPGGEAFVGVVYLVWKERPAPDIQSLAIDITRQYANKLVNR